MSYIFISYSKKDKSHVDNVARQLTQYGFSVWIDRQDIKTGDNWWASIVNAIQECTVFMIVLTENSENSNWVQQELKLAQNLSKVIFPILLEGQIWETIDDIHIANISDSKSLAGRHLKELSEHLPPATEGIILANHLNLDVELDDGTKSLLLSSVPSDANFDISILIDLFEYAEEEGRWHEALEMLRRIKESDISPPDFLVDDYEVDILYQIETEERQYLESQHIEHLEYQKQVQKKQGYERIIKRINKNKEPVERIAKSLYQFKQEYNNYDPEKLSLKYPPEILYIGKPFEWCEIPDTSTYLYNPPSKPDEFAIVLREINTNTFKIAKYPITNSQYAKFLNAQDGYYNNDWWEIYPIQSEFPQKYRQHNQIVTGAPNHPKTNVNWYEALAFCNWLSYKIEKTITLPLESQWQSAAQGLIKQKYPVGENFTDSIYNTRELRLQRTNAVTEFSQGINDFGVSNMCGNVWEWCRNDRSIIATYLPKSIGVCKGGSWFDSRQDAMILNRNIQDPKIRANDTGFRIVEIS